MYRFQNAMKEGRIKSYTNVSKHCQYLETQFKDEIEKYCTMKKIRKRNIT